MLTRLLVSLYGFAFFNKFLLLTPVYSIFMLQNGLTDLQLSTMFIVSAVATIFGQMPIAFLTNHIGQRYSMIFGQFLKIVAVILWLFWPTYFGFVIGMILWGLQTGFRSVAFEGLLYDSVSANGMGDEYTRILGRKSTYESIGVALSAFGSLLMFLGYGWVTWLSVAAIVMSIICLLMIKYTPPKHIRAKTVPFRKLFRTGMRVCLQIPCLLTTMVLALLAANIPYLDDFLSPIGLQLGIPTEYIGFMSLFLLGCATVGQRFAYKFKNMSDRFIYFAIAAVGMSYMIFGLIYKVGFLWLLGIGYILFYGTYTLLYSRLQHMIPSRHRSVVLSLYTTINYCIYIAVCGIVGLGSMMGSWRYSIVILGTLLLFVFCWAIAQVSNKCPLLQFEDED
ncbi:MAG: MFS transporter [Alphaproteobacteria bacterium]|nr:MFS transporter [Alphaproteobacteria bacterium]